MSEHEHEHRSCGGMSCREISDFLRAYLERELDGGVHEEFERHLEACPPCGHYLDGYSQTIEIVRTCGRAEPSQGERERPPEDLIQAILAAKQLLAPAPTDDP